MEALRIIAIMALIIITGTVVYTVGVSNGRSEGYKNGVASVDKKIELEKAAGHSSGYSEGYEKAKEDLRPVFMELARVADAQNYALSQSNRSTYCDFDQDYFGGYSGYCR